MRLLDGRSVRGQSSKRAVDIAVIQLLELLDHLLRQLFVGMGNAQLCCRLDQGCLRISDGRESLIEIGWHLTKIAACGLRRQSQGDTDLMDIRHCLNDFRLRDRLGGLPSIVVLPTYGCLRQQLLSPGEFNLRQLECGLAFVESGNAGMQLGHPVVDVVHGVLQFPAQAPGLCFDTAHRGRSRNQIRLCNIDGDTFFGDYVLERLLVQLGENISLVNRIVIVDQHPGYLPAYARGNEGHVAVHECVIRRDGVEGQLDPGDPIDPNGRHDQGSQHSY